MNRFKYRPLLFVVLLLCVISLDAAPGSESPQDILVYVNRSNTVTDISMPDLKQIYLKKKTTWPNGDAIIAVNHHDGKKEREVFRRKVLNMTATAEATYWEKEKIRSQRMPPNMVDNPLRAAFAVKGAIGYSFRKNVSTDYVNVVYVIPQ